jgi:hypothetical protein
MRATRRCLFGLLSTLVASGGCSEKPSPAEAEAMFRLVDGLASIIATCSHSGGRVEVKRAGQQSWSAIDTGAVFRSGDEVRTGPVSYARMTFLGGVRLEVQERSSVVVSVGSLLPAEGAESDTKREGRILVGAGAVRGFLPDAKPNAERAGLLVDAGTGPLVRLTAESGEAAVAYRLTRGEEAAELAITEGKARLTASGQTVALQSGQAVDIGSKGVSAPANLLAPPVTLSPAPDERFHFTFQASVPLKWKVTPRAAGYRVDVAGDASLQTLEVITDVDGTEFTFVPRAPGPHTWRVAARDRTGRYGEYGPVRRFFLELEKPVDQLRAPEEGLVVRYLDALPRLSFSWNAIPGASSYRLLVATGPSLFEQKIVSMVTSGQELDVDGLEAGTYYWGVYVEGDGTPTPIFSKPRLLVVKKGPALRPRPPSPPRPPPPPPKPEAPEETPKEPPTVGGAGGGGQPDAAEGGGG